MVSVIIPTYNYGRFIAEAIRSVLEQTCKDLECIVIDNGSTDNTSEVVKSFTDPRVIYLKQENKGVSNARNEGLKIAKGNYIQFLDADDLLEPDKLRVEKEMLDASPQLALVYSDMRYFKSKNPTELFYDYTCTENGKPWMKYLSGKGRNLSAEILKGNIMAICSPLVRKTVIDECGPFDEALEANEDWDFWMRIILAGHGIKYHDTPGTRSLVRIHKTSLSKDVFKMQVYGLRVLTKNMGALEKAGLQLQAQKRITDHVRLLVDTIALSSAGLRKSRMDAMTKLDLMNHFGWKEQLSIGIRKIKLKIKQLLGR